MPRRQQLQSVERTVLGNGLKVVVVPDTSVAVVGVAVRAPLARVPENAMKFCVGIMLTSFGTFWGAEGCGVRWPGNDLALLVLVPVVAVVSLGYVAWLRPAAAVKEKVTV